MKYGPKSALRVYLWALFTPARSFAAQFCKIFVAVKAAMAVLALLLPGTGVEYLSGDHLFDISGHIADGLIWTLALLFVRERDEARDLLKAAQEKEPT
jgi:hypothetical protein